MSIQIIVDRIWLQGEEALKPVLPLNDDHVCYQVPGMETQLEIQDYRQAGRAALEIARTREGAERFHDNFDTPALVSVKQQNGQTILELWNASDTDTPEYDLLWIAALVEEELPAWPTIWKLLSREYGNRRSFVAIME